MFSIAKLSGGAAAAAQRRSSGAAAGGGAGGGAHEAARCALERRLEELERANSELSAALHAAHSGSITMQGYLNKHRPMSGLHGLFAQEWELRYFVLSGSLLRYFKSERDAASFAPRGVVDVQGCLIELEESGGSRSWRFRVLEPGGNVLLRVATDNRAAAERWLGALEAAGLRVLPQQEPGRSAPASSGGGGLASPRSGAAYNDRRQQDRWEACSTDSELPDLPSKPGPAGRPRLGRPPLPPSVTAATAAAAVAEATVASSGVAAAARRGDDSDGEVSSRPGGSRGAHRRGGGGAAAGAAGAPRIEPQAGGGGAGGDAGSGGGAARPPMVGSTPVHTCARYSYLSSDGVWSAKHDGLLNLGIIVLLATNFRLILENLLKYGVRLNLVRFVSRSLAGRGNLPLVLAFPALLCFALAALGAEKLGVACLRAEEQFKKGLAKKQLHEAKAASAYASRVRRTEALLFGLNAANTTAALLLPCAVIHATRADAAPGFVLTLCTLCVWMKLVSYAHCHHDLRVAHRANLLRPGERGAPESDPAWATLRFPENLTVPNMLYFLAVPTLVYQVNFPTTPRIRKRWLLRRLVELACFCGLLLFMANQYLEPAVSNAMTPLSTSDWPRVAERVLKLALPNLYCWLCMFYCLFHLWLNILAELTRFGDREFYKDWWNAATVGEYWKAWNMPVHKWLLRTVYFPAMRAGMGRYRAMVLVFFISAVAHEVAVGVPLHMVKLWSFAGVMLQVPLISFTERLRKRLKSDTWCAARRGAAPAGTPPRARAARRPRAAARAAARRAQGQHAVLGELTTVSHHPGRPAAARMAVRHASARAAAAAGAASAPALSKSTNYKRVTVANYCGGCVCPCDDPSGDLLVHFVFTPVFNASKTDLATRTLQVKHCAVLPAFNTAVRTFHFHAERADASIGGATLGSFPFPVVDYDATTCDLGRAFTQVRTLSDWSDFKMTLQCEPGAARIWNEAFTASVHRVCFGCVETMRAKNRARGVGVPAAPRHPSKGLRHAPGGPDVQCSRCLSTEHGRRGVPLPRPVPLLVLPVALRLHGRTPAKALKTNYPPGAYPLDNPDVDRRLDEFLAQLAAKAAAAPPPAGQLPCARAARKRSGAMARRPPAALPSPPARGEGACRSGSSSGSGSGSGCGSDAEVEEAMFRELLGMVPALRECSTPQPSVLETWPSDASAHSGPLREAEEERRTPGDDCAVEWAGGAPGGGLQLPAADLLLLLDPACWAASSPEAFTSDDDGAWHGSSGAGGGKRPGSAAEAPRPGKRALVVEPAARQFLLAGGSGEGAAGARAVPSGAGAFLGPGAQRGRALAFLQHCVAASLSLHAALLAGGPAESCAAADMVRWLSEFRQGRLLAPACCLDAPSAAAAHWAAARLLGTLVGMSTQPQAAAPGAGGGGPAAGRFGWRADVLPVLEGLAGALTRLHDALDQSSAPALAAGELAAWSAALRADGAAGAPGGAAVAQLAAQLLALAPRSAAMLLCRPPGLTSGSPRTPRPAAGTARRGAPGVAQHHRAAAATGQRAAAAASAAPAAPNGTARGQRSERVPASIADVDNGKILGFGADLAEDHPGFHDADYKRRRVAIADIARRHEVGEPIPRVEYSREETAVWGTALGSLRRLFPAHACAAFNAALPRFGFREDEVPQLQDVSDVLADATGWRVRPVAGLMSSREFLAGLAFKYFHSTQYVRHSSMPAYTPEPDVVHELIGHVPMLAVPAFAGMVQAIGEASLGADEATIRHLTKVYWYTVEFGVVREGAGVKAFGAGVLSSFGELEHMAAGGAELSAFDPAAPLPKMSYRDGYQARYYVLESFEAGLEQLQGYAGLLKAR
ncbi:DGAT1C [Scenedesmus sp. PABB004]|nr:DGAT1C [Scenedesmus sp. PABB004]